MKRSTTIVSETSDWLVSGVERSWIEPELKVELKWKAKKVSRWINDEWMDKRSNERMYTLVRWSNKKKQKKQ